MGNTVIVIEHDLEAMRAADYLVEFGPGAGKNVEVVCPVCRGRRYQKSVLNVRFKEQSISDILDLSVDEAAAILVNERCILERLRILQDVGLGYLGFGQSTSTLSGGEAQRLKLAKELAKGGAGKALYLFDAPTVGFHPQDADRLIGVFDRLGEKGNSVIVIEHNLRVLLATDWIIDLGPEGGNRGGSIIAVGTPKVPAEFFMIIYPRADNDVTQTTFYSNHR
jgi:excinuclease ABC subunit A